MHEKGVSYDSFSFISDADSNEEMEITRFLSIENECRISTNHNFQVQKGNNQWAQLIIMRLKILIKQMVDWVRLNVSENNWWYYV